jgi:hypothetical protein
MEIRVKKSQSTNKNTMNAGDLVFFTWVLSLHWPIPPRAPSRSIWSITSQIAFLSHRPNKTPAYKSVVPIAASSAPTKTRTIPSHHGWISREGTGVEEAVGMEKIRKSEGCPGAWSIGIGRWEKALCRLWRVSSRLVRDSGFPCPEWCWNDRRGVGTVWRLVPIRLRLRRRPTRSTKTRMQGRL